MVGNVGDVDRADIVVWDIAMPGLVCLLRVLVPLTGKAAPSAELLQCASKPANTGKEVDEGKR